MAVDRRNPKKTSDVEESSYVCESLIPKPEREGGQCCDGETTHQDDVLAFMQNKRGKGVHRVKIAFSSYHLTNAGHRSRQPAVGDERKPTSAREIDCYERCSKAVGHQTLMSKVRS